MIWFKSENCARLSLRVPDSTRFLHHYDVLAHLIIVHLHRLSATNSALAANLRLIGYQVAYLRWFIRTEELALILLTSVGLILLYSHSVFLFLLWPLSITLLL